MLEPQKRPAVRVARHQQVVHEYVALALFHARAGGGMPAEVVVGGAAFVALEGCRRVHEGVVICAHVRGVQHPQPLVAANENVASHGHPSRDFNEQAENCPLNPVVHDHAIAVADVVPDAVRVGLLDNQVVAAGDAAGLVENLDGGREVTGKLPDVVAPDDVPLQEDIGGPDNVDPFRTSVADERVADDEAVPTEVSGNARAIR